MNSSKATYLQNSKNMYNPITTEKQVCTLKSAKKIYHAEMFPLENSTT